MDSLLSHKMFYNEHPVARRQLAYALLFFPFTVLALWIDSVAFAEQYFDGRIPANVLVLGYFALQYRESGSRLRKVLFTMVFLSYIGELLLCKLLGMYSYRTEDIPLYVPFGHAI